MRSRRLNAAPPGSSGLPSASTNDAPSAVSIPVPPSLVADPPNPMSNSSAPRSNADRMSWPTPKVLARSTSRCLRRDQLQSCGGGHLDDGQLSQRNVAVACGDGPAEGVGDLDFDVPAVQRVDDGIDGALAAVGHGNSHAFGVRKHRVHARTHRGDGLRRGHRLLERVRSENDLHRTGDEQSGFDMAFIVDHDGVGPQGLACIALQSVPKVTRVRLNSRRWSAVRCAISFRSAARTPESVRCSRSSPSRVELGGKRPSRRDACRPGHEPTVFEAAQHHVHRLRRDVHVACQFGVGPARVLRQDSHADVLRKRHSAAAGPSR